MDYSIPPNGAFGEYNSTSDCSVVSRVDSSFLDSVMNLISPDFVLTDSLKEFYFNLIFNFLSNLPYPEVLPNFYNVFFGIPYNQCNATPYDSCKRKNFRLKSQSSDYDTSLISCGLTYFNLSRVFCNSSFSDVCFAVHLPKSVLVRQIDNSNRFSYVREIYFSFSGSKDRNNNYSFSFNYSFLLNFSYSDSYYEVFYNDYLKYQNKSSYSYPVNYSTYNLYGSHFLLSISEYDISSYKLDFSLDIYYSELELSDILTIPINSFFEYEFLNNDFICKPEFIVNLTCGFCDSSSPDISSVFLAVYDENKNLLYKFLPDNNYRIYFNDEIPFNLSSKKVYFYLSCEFVSSNTVVSGSGGCPFELVDLCNFSCDDNSYIINSNFKQLRSTIKSLFNYIKRFENSMIDYTYVLTQIAQNISVASNDINTQLENISNKLETTEQIDNSKKTITDVLNQQANTIQVDDIGLLRSKKGYY